jgi:FkbM family methyltransferase
VQAYSREDHANGSEARLSRPDGRELPAYLRALRRLFVGGPRPLRAALLRATPRLLAPRLPELVFQYDDGRVFHLPAAPGPYAQIFTFGEFEPGETAAVKRLLRTGDLAIDVGANLGWFSLVMAAAVAPEGEVWAVEPMPPIVPALKRNLGLNRGLHVKLIEVALGAEAGRTMLHVFAGLPHGHASISTLDRTDYSAHEVGVRTLDDLLADAPMPAFVKLDVEGSERDVLLGAEKTLAASCPPIWMIEVNYETAAAFGYRPGELLEPFERRGDYRVLRIAGLELVPEREPEDTPDGSNWILLPACHEGRMVTAR